MESPRSPCTEMPKKKTITTKNTPKNLKKNEEILENQQGFARKNLGEEVRESIFVREYARHGNGAKAARAAGYSPSCAREQAYDLLTKPHIKKSIHGILVARRKRLDISADRIAPELFMIATSRNHNNRCRDKKARLGSNNPALRKGIQDY
jgi:hypothetical protein